MIPWMDAARSGSSCRQSAMPCQAKSGGIVSLALQVRRFVSGTVWRAPYGGMAD